MTEPNPARVDDDPSETFDEAVRVAADQQAARLRELGYAAAAAELDGLATVHPNT